MKTKHKFTPGPWCVKYGLNVEASGISVASCGINSYDEKLVKEAAWNAKLIAAAPELL